MSRRLACICLLLASGCGQDEELTGPRFSFRPAASGTTRFGEVPFPSDLYRDADGEVMNVPGIERVVEHHASIDEGLAQLDGFGRSTGALFFTDGFVDGSKLPQGFEPASAPDASVRIVDVDPDSPSRGTRYPALAKYLPSLSCLSVIPVPGVVLPSGVRHAVVVTREIGRADAAPD